MAVKTTANARAFLDPARLLEAVGLKPGMEVADFGCGAGHFAIPLARLVGDRGVVHAMDVRTEMLEAVVGRAKLERLYNIQAERVDLEAERGSKLKDGSQDMVVAANILFQARDQRALIGEAHRVLKPEGRLVAIEWHSEAMFGPAFALRPTPVDVKALAAEAGFQLEHTLEAGSFHFAIVFRK
ncbi:class I SAM-dependent methyltransferase [Candidatus Parcubacteria bacterium]|nr:class I SAM-dependent methyltransferase [Candidatus Parcubacteria bacterium]MBI4099279.1 class I SAM-dependent methyltransferase [Candidatus Parcubacteria bacterium]